MSNFFNKVKSFPIWALIIFVLAGVALGASVFAAVWLLVINPPQKSNSNLPPINKIDEIKPGETTVPTSTTPDIPDSLSTIPDEISGPLPFFQKPDTTKLSLDVQWSGISDTPWSDVPQSWGIKKALGSVVEASKTRVSQGDYQKLQQWLDDQNTNEYVKGKNLGTWLIGKVKSGKYSGSSLFLRHGNDTSDKFYRFLVSADGKQARLLDSLYSEPGLMGDASDSSSPEERLLFIEAYGLTWPRVKEGNYKTSDGKNLKIQGYPYQFVGGYSPDLLLDWLNHGPYFMVNPEIGRMSDDRKIYGEPKTPYSYIIDNGGTPLYAVSTIPEKSGHLAITWNTKSLAGRTLAKNYVVPPGGCGSNIWPGTPDEEEDLSGLNRVSIGTTSEGDSVYIPMDMTKSPTVRHAYDWWYIPDQSKKPSFEEFVAKYVPIIFWKDAFGRWVYYLDEQFMPAVECGKPVIYLYPTKTTNVSVKLPGFINVTVSDPAYPVRGWNVVAHPDGSLDYADGKTYGSLYWEGTGVNYQTPREGFVVKDGEQKEFLTKTLAKYGLNQKESQEFMDFWLPVMKGSPYYRVSFLVEDWSKAAPLYVNPRPDTNIRIFMDWQKLSAPIKITEPKITTPMRNGFTLVEWGGLLYK